MSASQYSNIVLAGFMGTGKSTVGRLVAARLDWDFVDTDALIEARARRSIAEIFAMDGEAGFRQLEATVCTQAGDSAHNVIAVGGGALLNDDVRARFVAHHLVVCLTCEIDTIIARVGDDPARPLFAPDREKLAALWNSRAAHYASLPHHVNTTHLNPEQTAEEVLRLWHQNR
ncbi:MAG: shikimate kinase [Anaerolineae bacterium]|nr:shikimate kinase [Anaerolineae bacterium]